jgi:hypothetical protein
MPYTARTPRPALGTIRIKCCVPASYLRTHNHYMQKPCFFRGYETWSFTSPREVLRLRMKMAVFCDVVSCSLFEINRRFRYGYCLWIVGLFLEGYTFQHPGRQPSSYSLPWKPKISDRLRIFESRLLTRIFGPQAKEVGGRWKLLHKEELRTLYTSPNISELIN